MRRRTVLGMVGAVAIAATVAGCGGDKTSGPSDTAQVDTGDDPDTVIIITYDTVVTEDAADTSPVQVDAYQPPQPGEFGYACAGNDDCNSGWCIQTANGRKCTRTCVEECPEFYDCRQAPGIDATFICVPRFTHLCDPCEEAADCNEAGQTGSYCLSYGPNGKFCGGECNNDANCPGGYVCRLVPVGGGGQARQCVPPDGTQCHCSDLAKSLQLSTTCYIQNDDGTCEGKRFCTQGGLNQCDAVEPYPESCNGADDNCNGIVDDFPPNYTCSIDNEFGSCPGHGTCVEGVETCVGAAPGPEQCNGIDDNCDGRTDEDLCDDQNPCTHDFCDSDGNCSHTSDNTLLCDDGNVCTQVDKCVDGFCKGFNPLPCGDGNPCFDYQCDAVAGCLSQYANGATCEDGQPCTVNDKCNVGLCVAGSWDPCDDGNPCTLDSCVAGQGCTHAPVSNGLQCGGHSGDCTIGQCISGACMGISANEGGTCTPSTPANQCQKAVCHSGTCTKDNINSTPSNPTICNLSGSDCTEGYCAAGACRALAGSPCSAEVDVGFCTDTVPGICTTTGSCTPTQQGNQCNCGSCSSFCITLCDWLCICGDFLFQ